MVSDRNGNRFVGGLPPPSSSAAAPSFGRLRMSHSVERDVTLSTSVRTASANHDRRTSTAVRPSASGGLMSLSGTPPQPPPCRRYSIASTSSADVRRSATGAATATFGDDDLDLDAYHRRRPPSTVGGAAAASQFRWSRKGVVYTADNTRSVVRGGVGGLGSHVSRNTSPSPSSSSVAGATAAGTSLSSTSSLYVGGGAARSSSLPRYVSRVPPPTVAADTYYARRQQRYDDAADDDDADGDNDRFEDVRRRARLIANRSRAASMSRIERASGGGSNVDFQRQSSAVAASPWRSSSVTRDVTGITSRMTTAAGRRRPSPGLARAGDYYYATGGGLSYVAGGGGSGGGGLAAGVGTYLADSDGLDIASFVLSPGERFVPTDVSVAVLPNGQRAVTYTRFSQKGHGDQSRANAEIERVVQQTKRLQDSMHTLETFVRNNRSLFPEDIIIYQHIIFYLLDEAELKRLGERRPMAPGAEVYGVKVRERLVAPYGTDVAAILKRYYSRYTEVDVEYMERDDIRRKLKDELGGDGDDGGGGATSKSSRRRRYRRTTDEVETEIDEEDGKGQRRPPQDATRGTSPDYDVYIKRHRSSSLDKPTLYIDEDSSAPQKIKSSKQLRPTAAPQITARLQPKRVYVGDPFRLNCSVSGEPEPAVTWFHDGHPITNNGRYRISNTFGLCALKVSEARPADAGLYTARAVNDLGEVSTTAEVAVDAEDLTWSTKNGEATRKPWFIVDARNTFAEVGQRAVFEAQATGRPTPTFRWKKDNVDVVLDNRVRVVSDDLGNTKLVIRDVKVSDAGVYFCIAENSDGKAKCAATLRVTNPDDYEVHRSQQQQRNRDAETAKYNHSAHYQTDDIVPVPNGRWPQFVQVPPLHISVVEGDPLTLRCVVDGHPKPAVTWFKGVRELTYSERHRVITEGDGDQHMMQIRSTLQTDPGEYTAVATNDCGHAKFTVFVNVLPRPTDEPDQPSNRPKLPMQHYELVKTLEKGKMPPIFIMKLPREKTIRAGQTLVFNCHVEEAQTREYLVDVGIVVKQDDGHVPKSDLGVSSPVAASSEITARQLVMSSPSSSRDHPQTSDSSTSADDTGNQLMAADTQLGSSSAADQRQSPVTVLPSEITPETTAAYVPETVMSAALNGTGEMETSNEE